MKISKELDSPPWNMSSPPHLFPHVYISNKNNSIPTTPIKRIPKNEQIKGVWSDHFWIHPSKSSFWYQMKAHIFLITPVNFYVQQMLLVKVTSENVAKV